MSDDAPIRIQSASPHDSFDTTIELYPDNLLSFTEFDGMCETACILLPAHIAAAIRKAAKESER